MGPIALRTYMLMKLLECHWRDKILGTYSAKKVLIPSVSNRALSLDLGTCFLIAYLLTSFLNLCHYVSHFVMNTSSWPAPSHLVNFWNFWESYQHIRFFGIAWYKTLHSKLHAYGFTSPFKANTQLSLSYFLCFWQCNPWSFPYNPWHSLVWLVFYKFDFSSILSFLFFSLENFSPYLTPFIYMRSPVKKANLWKSSLICV